MSINFEKANVNHVNIIFGWLAEPFVQEFWDNTQGHKDDILNFVNGRKEPSNYCDGKYFYWIASWNRHPFAMLMTIQETAEDHIDDIKLSHLSKTGNTYGIDYMIGDKDYFGKGYGAKTLSEFLDFFRREFDGSADTFIIDPASDNPRAKHVYMKAGFELIADFVMGGDCSGAGKSHHLLIRRFLSANKNHIKAICHHFNLGTPIQAPTRVHGGLLHIMWRLDTDKGSYAIKQLSKDIDLQNEQVIKNYELSEQIASSFIAQNIPGACALSQSDKHLLITDGYGYLVYPWVNAKALDKDEIHEGQALVIARILAKMHLINLCIEGIDQPEFDIHDNKYIATLIKQSTQMRLPFADILNSHLSTLLEINESYLGSIEILKKHTVVGHGDLDQKNVLWTENKEPLLIDWESARKLNPTYEIVNAALDWSGVTTNLKINLFHKMLKSYSESGGLIEKRIIEAAFYGVMGNWINWMVYNINRSINQREIEQKNIGIEQVIQVLPTILRVKTLMPELISEIAS